MPEPARRRLIVFDVVAGYLVGIIAATALLGAVASAAGWGLGTPSGIGGPAGRALTEAALGVELAEPPVPFTVKALLQIPFWAGLVGVPFLLARSRGRDIISDFGLRATLRDVPIGLVLGIAGQLLLIPLVYLPLRPFLDTDKVDDEAVALALEASAATGGSWALVLMVVVGAPIAEEIAYRGGILRSLSERVSAPVALIVSSVIFGLSHFQLVQLPALVAIGLVAGGLAHYFGRIGPAVWAHVGFNATAAIALLW